MVMMCPAQRCGAAAGGKEGVGGQMGDRKEDVERKNAENRELGWIVCVGGY